MARQMHHQTAVPPRKAANGADMRRRDLDLLRIGLVFGLVFFHTARIFDTLPLPEGVKNDGTSELATLVVVFFALWAMPLMFVIAGFSMFHSLRKRSPAAFLRDRVHRLLVPLLFGVLVIVPPQVYVHLRQADPSAPLSYIRFLPQFFAVRVCPDLFALICADPAVGLFTTAQLWFLNDLLIFSVILLPILLYLHTPNGEQRLGALTAPLARSGGIWLMALPIAAFDVALGAAANGGWKHPTFGVFVLCGYLLAADAQLSRATGRAWKRALAVGVVLALVYIGGAVYLSDVVRVDPTQAYDPGSLTWRAVKSVGAWAWIIAILGFGARPHKQRAIHPAPGPATPQQPRISARIIAYAGEAFLPFYILHQTVVFGIGFYVVQWALPGLAKYLIISVSALIGTLLIYEVAVRRTTLTRRLFGMRPARVDTGSE